jgi:F420-dependent oxidoreductase-like protein
MDLRIFIEPQQGASYDDQLQMALLAERLGFDAFFRSDHYLVMGDGSGLPGPTDSWVTLGALARETSTIRLGTLVTAATFRHPGILAISVAQVDEMSGGRIELGLGTGWFEEEHLAYGIPFPSVRDRFDILTEQLEILTGLWSTPVGERFSYTGQHFQLADSPALPKPTQTPLPLIVGGSGPRRTPALASRFAAEYNVPFESPEDTSLAFERVRAEMSRNGRTADSMVFSAAQVVCVGASEGEFIRRAAAIGRGPEELRANGLAGTVDEVIAKARLFARVGTTRLYLQVLDLSDHAHVELIASEVMPHLRG